MRSEDKCVITNRSSGTVIYRIPEEHIRRSFYPGETKSVPFKELQALVNQPGGRELLYGYMLIQDKEAAKELMNIDLSTEVEYNMSEAEIRNWLNTCSLDAFKDALDFAPDGVKDLIKKYSVELPLNDVAKREAMKKQLGFNVDKAIEIKREAEAPDDQQEKAAEAPATSRRVAEAAPMQRRVKTVNQKES